MKKSIFLLTTILVISSFSAISVKADFTDLTANLKKNELLNSRAVKLVIPRYSAEARKARAQGKVLVEVKVNEKGRVTEAKMIEGNQLFSELCEKAALASIIKPETADGKKIKFSGVIQYTFSITD